MYRRENAKTHNEFWGCSGYPDDCLKTINIGLKSEYESQSAPARPPRS